MAFLQPPLSGGGCLDSLPHIGSRAIPTKKVGVPSKWPLGRYPSQPASLTPPPPRPFSYSSNDIPLPMLQGATVASAMSSSVAGIAHTFHLFVAFILGGLFFSTALSIVTASVAIGKENVLRAWDLFKVVSGSVWNVFTTGLQIARDTLISFEDEEERRRWKWREAWKVLREQLTLTRKAAVEGVQAIKLEASIYSAAIGQPGLIALQYFVDSLTPKLLASMARENFTKALQDIKNPNVRKLHLEEFDFGTKGPTLEAARTYKLEDAMALDIDVDWQSEISAKVKVTSKRLGVVVPVKIKNFRFDGVVRVVLTPLLDEPPGFGAALVSFPRAPNIALDVSLSSVEVTKTPWLRTELLKEIQKSIAKEFLWPRRIVVPSGVPPTNPRPFLSRVELDALSQTDPLLAAESKIDQNDLVRKVNIKREVADANDLELDVFIGEGDRITSNEEESKVIGSEEISTGSEDLSEEPPRDGRKWTFPWARKKRENTTGEVKSAR